MCKARIVRISGVDQLHSALTQIHPPLDRRGGLGIPAMRRMASPFEVGRVNEALVVMKVIIECGQNCGCCIP